MPVQVCERNFDNLRRIYKRVIETCSAQKAPLPALRRHYLLSDALAVEYIRMTFVRLHRWEVAKKKLVYATFADVQYMAAVLMHTWTAAPLRTLELDAVLRGVLRDVRATPLGDKHQHESYAARVCVVLFVGFDHSCYCY